MKTPEFSISILTYSALQLAKKCIESVLYAGGNFELILTDNGGPAEVGRYFDELGRSVSRTRRITVFHNKTNEGFIDPNRKAFKVAKGKYFVLLNDDTLVSPEWLNMLKAPFTVDPKCAMTGPGGTCCQLRADFHGEVGPRFEYLEGSMLCMNRELIASIEPDLFPAELVGAYGEDSYLSLRVREAGYHIQRVALKHTHYGGATSAMVPQCREWQQANHAFLRARFQRYMVGHTFEYPTLVKRNAAWGDVLLTTPIIRALKKMRPLSPIWVETALPEVFSGNPDVAYVSHTPLAQPMAHVMVNLNGISEMNPGVPILEAYAGCAGVELAGETTAMYPCGGDVEWAQRMVPGKRWVAIHPGPTTWRCKNWPFDRWAKVIEAVRNDGWLVVLVGADNRPAFAVDMDLRGKTTTMQLAALLGEVEMMVGVDSFPIHVAQAMKTPVVGLFGITTARNILTGGSRWMACESDPKNGGTGLRHRLFGKTLVDFPENPMDTITVEQVIETIRRMAEEITA